MTDMACDIAHPERAEAGWQRIEWAWAEMPVLRALHDELADTKPLAGLRISGCLHITTETANLARALQAAGADLVLCASNPLSTQDDVAAALVKKLRIPVFACHGEDTETYYRHIEAAIAHGPQITLDDGADLISTLHRKHPDRLPQLLGGTEETTTGVIRLRAMAADGALGYPVIAVNDAMTKHLFDNRYGTGQSALDGIIRATNRLIAGKTFVVCGYGWCGRGLAMRAAGHGAHVVVTEVDPLRALEAAMDGHRVMPLIEAAREADFIVTVTGDKHVVRGEHFQVMKDGCILANAGHFDVEIDIPALEDLATAREQPRPHVTAYHLSDGRRLYLLCQGRLVNLAAAEGHPSAVMDMSFANQVLAVLHLAVHGREMPPAVHPQPPELDRQVAEEKLAASGIAIDTLTDEQRRYLASWREGT